MNGFVIQIDHSKKYEKYNRIKKLITSSVKEERFMIDENEIKICYSNKYNFIQHQLTTLNFAISFENIDKIDQDFTSYMVINIQDKIEFCSDRFSSYSLLYEITEDSIIISNLQCPNTSIPNEWYTVDYKNKHIEKHNKYGKTIEQYYAHLFGERMEHPIHDLTTAVNKLNELLSNAVKECIDDTNNPIPILFSGGIDSSLIAYYTLLHCGNREVELYNVSCLYENTYDSPDRLCAKAVLEDLKKLFPTKVIHFVEIDIQKEIGQTLSQELIPIIYPNDTVMDLSIATATSLALTQEGHCDTGKKKRVVRRVLCGQGSDEQLGGYGRHRNAKKWNKLSKELEMDFCRLWNRNTARDSRVNDYCNAICFYPFLNSDLIRFIRNIPEEFLVKLDLPENEGNKWILREVSRSVGMIACASFKKTAIQFGTRMAKLLNNGKKVNGGDRLSQE
ncbi:asparagine synthetase, putative [Entamoeba dispar SAW760]|uniref:Asparagine synthetase, putative n=1 Tax=Entamoeba dispar (strain ATCC PRA-260 / SAW760) TaxID=370354 RepID=B0ET49_ENTDS|nr:asparagine synthetase, putative [Entamoeba dispar SAW760]EDR22302.1 asparagine synthetase, putative [Entamoeba dispar SAW760]|eukprot:EDR22302.1 asparagine synthetase, putative [Entamoeba dispar SAW760]